MSKVIGIDPDVKKSGIAVYEDGKLTGLLNLTLPQYIEMLPMLAQESAVIAIEDSSLNRFVYARNNVGRDSLQVKLKKAMSVGRIQQQSIVMGQLAEAYGIAVNRYKPCAGNFESYKRSAKANCLIMLKATGWDGKSNPETRSAAYFGFKHVSKRGIK